MLRRLAAELVWHLGSHVMAIQSGVWGVGWVLVNTGINLFVRVLLKVIAIWTISHRSNDCV
jgi:hypothetical protein